MPLICKIFDHVLMLFLFMHQHDDKGFAHPERIQKLVKNYSQFVSFPIYTWQEKGYSKEVCMQIVYELVWSLI